MGALGPEVRGQTPEVGGRSPCGISGWSVISALPSDGSPPVPPLSGGDPQDENLVVAMRREENANGSRLQGPPVSPPSCEQWDLLPSIAAVYLEIMIRGPNERIAMQFRHPHQAGISQTHGSIAAAVNQFQNMHEMIGQREFHPQNTPFQQRGQSFPAIEHFLQQIETFRQNRLAGEAGTGHAFEVGLGPCVVEIALQQCSHDHAAIDDHGFFHTRPGVSCLMRDRTVPRRP